MRSAEKKMGRHGGADENAVENERKKMNPTTTRPSFFKIISSGHNDVELRIPPYFSKHVQLKMYDQAVLCDPSGSHWRVKLQKRSQEIYLEDGWQQFVSDHSLGSQEFLTFSYAGDTRFDVRIFDKSGCERVGDKRKREVPSKGCPNSSSGTPLEPTKAITCTGPAPEPTKAITCMAQTRRKKQPEALGMAGAFSSRHPHFLCCIKKYNIENSILYIPSSFSKHHLPRSKSKITLRNSEGKTWEMSTSYAAKRGQRLSAGWTSFARYSKVKCGDTCIFELVEKDLLQVHIFPPYWS